MISTLLPPTATDRAVCNSCPHDAAAHDVTAARYCAATSSAHADRGCICRVDPVAVGWRTASTQRTAWTTDMEPAR